MKLTSCFLALLVSFCFVLLPSTSFGQLSSTSRTSMSATIQMYRPTLDSRRLPVFDEAEGRVVAAVQAVEDYFRPITSTDNLAKWKLYLATEPLLKALQSDASEEKILDHAQRTRARLIGNIDGLELAALTRLRDSVEELIIAARFTDAQSSIKLIDQQLQALDERIAKTADIPTPEEAASLAAIAKLIDESNQAPAIFTAMRAKFSRPNVVMSVDSSQLLQSMSQVVNRTRPINDCILGTRIVGTGTLEGTVTARTLPAHGQAAIELTLTAHLNSRSTGYNHPVSLQTLGNGDVRATRSIFVTENGISLSPTTTTANLSTQITSINHPLRLVRRIASKQAAQQKPQADAIAREKFRQQVGSEFDSQVTQTIQSAPKGNRETALATARKTLLRLHLPEPSRAIGSTSHSIFLEATQAASDQFAAANSAPMLTPGSYGFAVQVHESTIDNMAAIDLAGRTMSGEQLDKLLVSAGRVREPGDKQADDTEKSFVIDFAKFRPIIFEARDQTVKLGIRGTRFKQGERELKQALEITASYRPVHTTAGSTYLERIGDVGIEFPGGRRLTITQVALRRSMQRIFEARFPPTILNQTVTLPATIAFESLRGKNLRVTSIDSKDGWLSISAR